MNMKVMAAINLSIQIEKNISECYAKVNETFPENMLREDLEKLARDELTHMELLRTGKKYVFKAPEAFPESVSLNKELKQGHFLTCKLKSDLEKNKLTFYKALMKLHALEKRYERVHLNTLIEVKDSSLAELFKALAAGDNSHWERLETMMKRVKLELKL